MKQYVCGICGYIHDEAVGGKWEDLPADWKCPVCKAGKDAFKPKEEKTASQEVLEKPHVDNEKMEEKKMEKWKCTVCGYIHEGPMTPDFKCPICKQPANKFVKIEDAAAPAKNPYAGTKTEKNLWEAFAGESQARNKYTYFASVAKKAGYEQIAAL